MKARLLFVVVALSLAQCYRAGIHFNSHYTGIEPTNRPLTIIRVGNPTVIYEGNVENEFGVGNTDSLIVSFIDSILPHAFSLFSTFSVNPGLEIITVEDSSKLRKVSNSRFSISIPDSILISALSLPENSIALVLNNLLIESVVQLHTVWYGFVPAAVIPTKPLSLMADFCYWDISANKPIAYGIGQGAINDGTAVRMQTWRNAVARFSKSMLDDTKFRNEHGR